MSQVEEQLLIIQARPSYNLSNWGNTLCLQCEILIFFCSCTFWLDIIRTFRCVHQIATLHFILIIILDHVVYFEFYFIYILLMFLTLVIYCIHVENWNMEFCFFNLCLNWTNHWHMRLIESCCWSWRLSCACLLDSWLLIAAENSHWVKTRRQMCQV